MLESHNEIRVSKYQRLKRRMNLLKTVVRAGGLEIEMTALCGHKS